MDLNNAFNGNFFNEKCTNASMPLNILSYGLMESLINNSKETSLPYTTNGLINGGYRVRAPHTE